MAEIVLSEKQQKKALRKKKSNKQTLKNILSAPEELHWPLIKGNDVKTVRDALTSYLPRVRDKKIVVKYKDIKGISKEARKAYRQNVCNGNVSDKEESNDRRSEREHVIFGINHVDRSVSDGRVGFVLISNDVNPRFILDGIVQNCLVLKTPFLVVPDLRKSLKCNCGVRSMIVAIRADVESGSKLSLLSDILNEVCLSYSPPVTESVPLDSIQKSESKIESKAECSQSGEDIKLEDIYLIRKSKSERIFDPASESKCVNSTEYLSFGGTDGYVTCKQSVYRPLIVKRVRNDPNRNRKRIKNSK